MWLNSASLGAQVWQCPIVCVPLDTDISSVETTRPMVSSPAYSFPIQAPLSASLSKDYDAAIETKETKITAGRSSLIQLVEKSGGIRKTFCKLLMLWPLSIFLCASRPMLMPIFPFVTLNFFARKYTELSPYEIHCERDPSVSYCVAASAEATGWICAVTSASAALQVVTSPLLGVLSDVLGRKKMICLLGSLQVVPVALLFLHVQGCVSFYIVLLFYPLLSVPFLSVYYTIAVDLVRNSDDRAIAFNLIASIDNVFAAAGFVGSAILDIYHTIMLSFVGFVCLFLYVVLILSETLQSSKRAVFSCRAAIPGLSMMAFFKDKFRCQLIFVFICGTAYIAGSIAILPMYLQQNVDFTSTDVTIVFLITQVSAIATMAVTMTALQKKLGDELTLCLSLFATCALSCILPCLQSRSGVFTSVFCFMGFGQLLTPVAVNIVSKISKDREQGEMQGALNAWAGVASTLGPLLYNSLYQTYDSGTHVSVTQRGVPFWVFSGLLLMATLICLVLAKNASRTNEEHLLSGSEEAHDTQLMSTVMRRNSVGV